MKFRNQALRFGAGILGTVAAFPLLAADESGITTTAATAAITDGQAKGLVIALAMLTLVVVFKIVKKVRGAA